MYFQTALSPDLRRKAIKKAKKCLHELNFDTIVVRGASGMTFGGALAYEMNKNLYVVRKPEDSCHSHFSEYGNINKYIILDDFISLGKTVEAIVNHFNLIKFNEMNTINIGFYGYELTWEIFSKNWDKNVTQKAVLNRFGIENLNLRARNERK